MLHLNVLLALACLSPVVDIGDTVRPFTLTDIRFLPRSLDELLQEEVCVLVFVTIDCPLAQRYTPRIAELEREYRKRGVRFALVHVGPGDSILEIGDHMVEQKIEFPVLKDFEGDAVNALGITRTPQAAVLDREHRLRYRGRIDGQYRLGGVRPTPGREDLREALEDVLAGREVREPETPVDGCLITREHGPPEMPDVTWARDVAPIVMQHCADCHHPEGEAPFALLTFEDAANNAAMIAEVVRQRRMPPWYASEEFGEFTNHRGLSRDERQVLRAWVAAGTPPGDLDQAPEPPELPASKWKIGEPDTVLTALEPVKVPPDGYMPYQHVILPHVFPEDTWVTAIQILPTNERVLHHANLAYFNTSEGYKSENFITGQVPGGIPMNLGDGIAVKIPAGSMLGLQAHYVTTGQPETDRLSVGLRYARGTVEKRLHHYQIADYRFEIPPGAPAHEVRASQTTEKAITGLGLFCHMHLRGRDMTIAASYPDESDEVLLRVPSYNFDWQMSYTWKSNSMLFPAGTRFDVVAHFDNSPFNPYNPDPTVPVRFGRQTFHEMMYGFLFFTVDEENLGLEIDPQTGQVLGSDP